MSENFVGAVTEILLLCFFCQHKTFVTKKKNRSLSTKQNATDNKKTVGYNLAGPYADVLPWAADSLANQLTDSLDCIPAHHDIDSLDSDVY